MIPCRSPHGFTLDDPLIHVTPAPVLARLERLDDRMLRRVEVFRGMLVLRRVAAADVPADETEAKMHPPIARRQALLTAVRAGRDLAHLIQVRALSCHRSLLLRRRVWASSAVSPRREHSSCEEGYHPRRLPLTPPRCLLCKHSRRAPAVRVRHRSSKAGDP